MCFLSMPNKFPNLILEVSLSNLLEARQVLVADNPEDDTEAGGAGHEGSEVRYAVTVDALVAAARTIRLDDAVVVVDSAVEQVEHVS